MQNVLLRLGNEKEDDHISDQHNPRQGANVKMNFKNREYYVAYAGYGDWGVAAPAGYRKLFSIRKLFAC